MICTRKRKKRKKRKKDEERLQLKVGRHDLHQTHGAQDGGDQSFDRFCAAAMGHTDRHCTQESVLDSNANSA